MRERDGNMPGTDKTQAQLITELWDKAEDGGETEDGAGTAEEVQEGQEAATEAPEGGETEAAGEKPEATPASTAAAPAGKQQPSQKKAGKEAKPSEPQAQAEAVATAAGAKAPQSWPVATRQHWETLPQEVRAAVTKREREVVAVLNSSAEARKLATTVQGVLKPFADDFRAAGVQPLQGVRNLLEIQRVLSSGSKDDKASMVANLIRTCGVDVPTLATQLDGKAAEPQGVQPQPSAPSAAPEPRELRDPRVDAMISAAQKQKAAKDKAALERFLETDPEFLDDVKEHMYRLAGAPGYDTLPWEELYEIACLSHKEVRSLYLERRNAAKAEATARAATPARPKISSSVRHEPTAPPANGGQPKSRRELIAEAWDEHERRR